MKETDRLRMIIDLAVTTLIELQPLTNTLSDHDLSVFADRMDVISAMLMADCPSVTTH